MHSEKETAVPRDLPASASSALGFKCVPSFYIGAGIDLRSSHFYSEHFTHRAIPQPLSLLFCDVRPFGGCAVCATVFPVHCPVGSVLPLPLATAASCGSFLVGSLSAPSSFGLPGWDFTADFLRVFVCLPCLLLCWTCGLQIFSLVRSLSFHLLYSVF